MASILITLGSHLSRNPRAVRAATALGGAGHQVLLVGPVYTEEGASEDATLKRSAPWEYQPSVDLRKKFGTAATRLRHRLIRRVSTNLVRLAGVQLPESLGYAVRSTQDMIRRRHWDLHIGYQEVGAHVSYQLGKEGRCVATDLEDWYSRDLLPEAQRVRPLRLLRECERFAVRSARYASTTSHAMAGAMQQAYGGGLPTVIYNAFPLSEREHIDARTLDRRDLSKISLHWVSQTIGSGRGLETLCEALRQVSIPIELHLRGFCTSEFESQLQASFPSHHGHRLFVHPQIPANELLSRVAEHDIGLALELRQPDSRNLTVTYKFFHYLLAGLAVVASDTAGQSEVTEGANGAVYLYRCGDAQDLARQLNLLLSAPERLATAKKEALAAARETFCWENQVPKLLEAVEVALRR